MGATERAAENFDPNDPKFLAKQVFKCALKSKMIYNKKEVKFYHIDGVKMASLSLDFECPDENGHETKCQGCNQCMPDRIAFGEEYDRLKNVYKRKALENFLEVVDKSSKKSQQKEFDL